MSARAREFFGLVPVAVLVTAGFTAVLISRASKIQTDTVVYGALFLGCCLLAHLFIRAKLPDADPYLFPLAALLAAFGLVMLYRIEEPLARSQALVFGLGLGLLILTVLGMRDHHTLQRYQYLIGLAGVVLLAAPLLPGIGVDQNGARLAVNIGFAVFQPAELAKVAIIIFLASYLADNREVLLKRVGEPTDFRRALPVVLASVAVWAFVVLALHRSPWSTALVVVFLGSLAAVVRERPSLKHIGPLLLVWGLAMLMLIFIRDLGSSLMFFGGFLILLYIATARLSFVALGASLFAGGATFLAGHVPHVQDRVDSWLHPFDPDLLERPVGGSYQLAQSLFAQADGGLFGTGFGRALLFPPGGDVPILPLAKNDLIYALITNEVGLYGACAVLLVSLLIAQRGFKTAMLATDDFSKLLAAGLASVFALQVFVIVGGVTRLIPLTGVTLPFISAGGSSLIANFILLALLLIVSNEARRGARQRGLS